MQKYDLLLKKVNKALYKAVNLSKTNFMKISIEDKRNLLNICIVSSFIFTIVKH